MKNSFVSTGSTLLRFKHFSARYTSGKKSRKKEREAASNFSRKHPASCSSINIAA